uniref:Uncharacterized protein n=2 Tax=Pyxicephalus adspersus TaxID=30357 RepID=A0AAV3B3I1_PYXAD|nr:TPA: hypothetical protein GDO54_001677 [Pyxicephalus adspersus]
MALTSLLLRLNCAEYKNWMKAGYCLQILQSRLQGYIDVEMQRFHRQLRQNMAARQRHTCQCRSKGKQFQPNCAVCKEWKEHILNHHNNKNGEIHWGNCNPSLWPTHYWEVAKVIKCRNDLMHSSDMKVSSSWLDDFGQKIQELIYEFRHVPSLVNEADQIQEVLLTDWSVDNLSVYEVDGCVADGGENFCIRNSSLDGFSLNELEIQLVSQLLEELYLQKEENGALSEEDQDSVRKMKTFLTENQDLLPVFQDDLKKLEHLLS